LLAWATDLSSDEHRGRGIASLYISMELGIGVGALASGWVYANSHENFITCFGLSSFLALMALVFLFARKKKQQ
jgi:predicted MFS family arabinose efflux permease